MPANLTPQYLVAEQKYREAKSPEEKLEMLELMLKEIPKHKGTERLQGELKHKIAEQRKAVSSPDKGKKKAISYSVDSCGYQQVVAIGGPNCGKSKLLCQLTGADLKVADYPFTTRMPQPAMMQYEDIRIQLVDTPAISEEHADPWMGGIVRSADAVLLLADLTNADTVTNIETILDFLRKQKVVLHGLQDKSPGEEGCICKNTLLVAHKKDAPDAEIMLDLLKEAYPNRWEILPVSSLTGENLDALRHKIYELLDIMRIIPKPPGKKPDFESPILLKKGSNVVDLAATIHQDLAKSLKSARIWNAKNYTDGQKIPVDYLLEDKNIVELEA